jgi:hypothetical protein
MTADRRARGPDTDVAAPKDRHPERSSANQTSSAGHGSSPLAEMVEGPRPWSHRQEDCATCVTYRLLTDRRRRQEIVGLKRAQRIIDLGAA